MDQKFWTTILLKANRNVLIEANPRKSPNSGFSALTAGCWYKARVIFVACEHILAQVSGSFFAFYCIDRILSSSSNYLSTNCFYANFKFSQAKARDNFVAPWSLPDLASGQTWVSRVRFPLGLQGWRLHFSQSWCKGRNVDLSSKLDGLIRPDFNQKHCRFSSELNNKWQIS